MSEFHEMDLFVTQCGITWRVGYGLVSNKLLAVRFVKFGLDVFVRCWLSLCVELSVSPRGQHYGYIWSAAIRRVYPKKRDGGEAYINKTVWSTQLSYVCQYHSK